MKKVFLGETVQPPARSSNSPWPMVFATSAVGAVTTWVFEEIVRHARKKKRRR